MKAPEARGSLPEGEAKGLHWMGSCGILKGQPRNRLCSGGLSLVGWIVSRTPETHFPSDFQLEAPEEFLFLRRCGFAELSRRNEQLLEDVKVIEASWLSDTLDLSRVDEGLIRDSAIVNGGRGFAALFTSLHGSG